MNRAPSRINAGFQTAAPSVDPLSVGQPGEMLLTRVALAFIDQRINLYLRFGRPQRECGSIDGSAVRSSYPTPSLRASSGRETTTGLHAGSSWCCKPASRWTPCSVSAVFRPGARTLLHVEGERRVRIVLTQIDIIEALGIDPIDVSPSYWQTLGNRLAAGLPTPTYTTERHAAWLTARSGYESRAHPRFTALLLTVAGLALLIEAFFVRPTPRLIYNASDSVQSAGIASNQRTHCTSAVLCSLACHQRPRRLLRDAATAHAHPVAEAHRCDGAAGCVCSVTAS